MRMCELKWTAHAMARLAQRFPRWVGREHELLAGCDHYKGWRNLSGLLVLAVSHGDEEQQDVYINGAVAMVARNGFIVTVLDSAKFMGRAGRSGRAAATGRKSIPANKGGSYKSNRQWRMNRDERFLKEEAA